MSKEVVVQKFVKMAQDVLAQVKSGHGKFQQAKTSLTAKDFEEAAGFAVMISSKGALGISVERGDGFVVANRGKGEGKVNFSAPLFIHLSKVGVGFQLGYTQMYTVMLFSTSEQLDAFSTKEILLGTDTHFNGEPSMRAPEDLDKAYTTLQPATHLVNASKVVTLADGVIVDLSVTGGRVSANKEINELIYGADVLPVNILSGDVASPEEFGAVYASVLSI